MKLQHWLADLLNDPSPRIAFELADGIVSSLVYTDRLQIYNQVIEGGIPLEVTEALNAESLAASLDGLNAAVENVVGHTQNAKKGKAQPAVLLLPDSLVRIFVLDFEQLPADKGRRVELIKARLRRALPYDVDEALLVYFYQSPPRESEGIEVVVATIPFELLLSLESIFRRHGFEPGWVTTSMLMAAELAPEQGTTVFFRQAGRLFSSMVIESGKLRLYRSLVVETDPAGEVAGQLYPTCAFVEDHLGGRVDHVLIAAENQAISSVVEEAAKEFGFKVFKPELPDQISWTPEQIGLIAYSTFIAKQSKQAGSL